MGHFPLEQPVSHFWEVLFYKEADFFCKSLVEMRFKFIFRCTGIFYFRDIHNDRECNNNNNFLFKPVVYQ